MAYVLTMPKLGLTMDKGTVTEWYKREGEWIDKGEPICEIETDKILNVIESPESGYLRVILVKEMEEAEVKVPIGVIGELEEDISGWNKTNEKVKNNTSHEEINKFDSQHEEVSPQVELKNEQRIVAATPAAKAFAKQHGILLEQIIGTGPNGRIQERDVIQYYGSKPLTAKLTPAALNFAKEENININNLQDKETHRISVEDLKKPADIQQDTISEEDIKKESKRVVLKGIRKAIANNMKKSWETIPHVTLHRRVDITELLKFNQEYISSTFSDRKITITHQLTKACAILLERFDYINSSLIDNEIVYHGDINIGVAVATEQGLLVPVIKNANKKHLLQISDETKQFGLAAREQKLNLDDLKGGTFTISNLGMYKIDYFTPIINPPEAAILGVGRVDKENDKDILYLSLSFDHRIVDGAEAAMFLDELAKILNKPLNLFV